MKVRKSVVVTAAIGAIAIATAFAVPDINPFRVFRTVVAFLTVQQGTEPLQYTYNLRDGVDLSTLALGTAPNSNQVFAMTIDCDSSEAFLVCFDKSITNTIMTIAQSTSFTTVKQQVFNHHTLKAGNTNDERFVAQFIVETTNDLAGGFLTVAGRLHLDTNGCPTAVAIALDKDPQDSDFDDKDVTDTEQDAKVKDIYRAGQAHFLGVVYAISDGSTNTWLVPLGHMSFRHLLDQYDVDP